jgi:hypothetical protein
MAKNFDSYSNFHHKQSMRDSGYPAGVQPIDLQNDKMLYGRVDGAQDAVILINKKIPGTERVTIKRLDSEKPMYALTFVADAFKDLKLHFTKATAFSRLTTGGVKEITELEAKAAWHDPQLAYDRHIARVFKIFKDSFLFGSRKHKEVITFTDYMEKFNDFFKNFGDELPLTKTGFIKSRLAPPLVSGMIIEVAKPGPDEHSSTATKWISDPNFNFYRNAAIKYGFLVDKNMPWRLVADISSKFMQDYWRKTTYPAAADIDKHRRDPNTGLPLETTHQNYLTDAQIMKEYLKVEDIYGLTHAPGGASDLFEKFYEKTFFTDALELKEIFYKMYNNFVSESPSVSKLTNISCTSKKLSKGLVRREQLTRYNFERHYDIHYWIKICLGARITEEVLAVDRVDRKRMLRNAKVIMKKTLDTDSAMKYINNMIKVLKSQIVNPRYCQNYQSCL